VEVTKKSTSADVALLKLKEVLALNPFEEQSRW
jgi:hypothetical protein